MNWWMVAAVLPILILAVGLLVATNGRGELGILGLAGVLVLAVAVVATFITPAAAAVVSWTLFVLLIAKSVHS
jgi:hypothetical protein